MHARQNIVITTLAILLCSSSYAGRDSEYSDRYAKFSLITKQGSSVFFAGSWTNRFVVAEYDAQGRWRLSSIVGNTYYMDRAMVFEVSDGLLFMSATGLHKKFLFESRTWEPTAYAVIEPQYQAQYRAEEDSLTIEGPAGPESYAFPIPSLITFTRLRHLPGDFTTLEARVGSSLSFQDDLWFTIDFYDGEGMSGIGGLGFFDRATREFGVVRDRLLSECSDGLMEHFGDTVFIATNSAGEYGTYGDKGLVLVDLKKGTISQVPGSAIDGEYFLAVRVLDNTLWITTDRAIVSWNLKSNAVTSQRIESLVLNKDCSVYRRPKLFTDFSNGGLPTRLAYDSTIAIGRLAKGDTVVCESPGWDFAEVRIANAVTGWINKKRAHELSEAVRLMPRYPDDILYAENSLKTPIHSFQSSSITIRGETEHAAKVTVNGAWVRAEDADPVFTEFRGTLPTLTWRSVLGSFGDIRECAIRTLELEEAEARSGAPILDTVLTISDTVDLFDKFYGVRRLFRPRWLPSGKFEPNLSPEGIELNRHSVFRMNRGTLEYNGKPVAPGDSLAMESDKFVFSYIVQAFVAGGSERNILRMLRIRYVVNEKRRKN